MVSDDSPAKTTRLMASSKRIVMEVTCVSRTRSLLAIGVNILVVVSFRERRESLRVFNVERNVGSSVKQLMSKLVPLLDGNAAMLIERERMLGEFDSEQWRFSRRS